MLISVIIPVYNGENKIKRCLDSVKRIKEKELEVIIVNDGSTDNTKFICEEYAHSDDRFHLVNQVNGGVSRARNTGISVSKGKYIGFVDADDEVTDDFAKIVDVLKKSESDFVVFCHCTQTVDELQEESRYLLSPGKNNMDIMYNNFLAGYSNCVWNNIYKSSVIKEYNISFPENMSMGEDSVFNARYLRYCKEVFFVNCIGYKYYIDDGASASNMGKVSYLKDFVRIYDECLHLYTSCNSLNVEFRFYGAYYIDKTYFILRQNRKQISSREKEEYRRSALYNRIINEKYKSWRRELKKWYIKIYMCIR